MFEEELELLKLYKCQKNLLNQVLRRLFTFQGGKFLGLRTNFQLLESKQSKLYDHKVIVLLIKVAAAAVV